MILTEAMIGLRKAVLLASVYDALQSADFRNKWKEYYGRSLPYTPATYSSKYCNLPEYVSTK